MSELKGYTDLDQYGNDLKILQHLDVPISMRRKNTTIVQNITVRDPVKDKAHQSFYELVLGEIYELGGMRQFINRIYDHAVEHYGSKSRAAIKLGINRSTLTYFEQKDE